MFRIPGARAPTSYYLLRHAPEQPNLRQVRPGVEVIGRQDLELDIAGRRRRKLAFLVAGLEQQPVRPCALADRTKRACCALISGQDFDLLRIEVIAGGDQNGQLVKARGLPVLEGVDSIGVRVGPRLDLDPIVLLPARDLAPAFAWRRQQLPALLRRQQVDVVARGGSYSA